MGDSMSFRVGDTVKCKVVGIQTYGVFVEIGSEYSGLIHISEISKKFVNNITDYVTINEIIYAKVLEIDHWNKQVKLSIKNINYRGNVKTTKVHETPHGFEELRKSLPIFIKNKLNEYISRERT